MKQLFLAVAVDLLSLSILSFALAPANVSSHSPIVIQSDADFTNCACVTSGMGTQANPYVIGPWSINSNGGTAVSISGANLTKSFVLQNPKISGQSTSTDRGIVLNQINPSGTQSIVANIVGAQTSIQNTSTGILLQNSSYVVLDGAGENPNGAGIVNTGAGTINTNLNGAVVVENSSHISVKGWQITIPISLWAFLLQQQPSDLQHGRLPVHSQRPDYGRVVVQHS